MNNSKESPTMNYYNNWKQKKKAARKAVGREEKKPFAGGRAKKTPENIGNRKKRKNEASGSWGKRKAWSGKKRENTLKLRKEKQLVGAKREKERIEAEKRERADAEIRVQQQKIEEEKVEKELFENWDLHMPVDVESEREQWMNVLSTSEDPQLTSMPDGSDVRKVHVVQLSHFSGYF